MLGNWKTMEHEGDNYTNRDWCFWYSHQRIIKGTGWQMLEDEWIPSKLQKYWERPEYWEASWRLEETCCHSGSCERPSAKTDVKNSQWVNNNNNNKSTRPSDRQQNKIKEKQTCWILDFAGPVDYSVKLKVSEERNKFLDLSRELKKTMKHENDSNVTWNRCKLYSHQEIDILIGRLGNKWIWILRIVLETGAKLLSFTIQWKSIS